MERMKTSGLNAGSIMMPRVLIQCWLIGLPWVCVFGVG